MGIVLACITDRSDLALQVSCLLSRSNVAVNIRFKIPDEDTPKATAPFEIILLTSRSGCKERSVDQLILTVDWLKRHGARRYWIIHNASITSHAFRNYRHLTSVVAAQLINQDDTARRTVEQQIVHCQYQDDTYASVQRDYSSIISLRSNAVSFGHVSLFNELKALTSASINHVAVHASKPEDLLTFVRGTERVEVLAGNPLLALHLPALLRIRGWLTNNHQVDTFPPERLRMPETSRPTSHFTLSKNTALDTLQSMSSILENTPSDTIVTLEIPDAALLVTLVEHAKLDFLHLCLDDHSSKYHCIGSINSHLFQIEIPSVSAIL